LSSRDEDMALEAVDRDGVYLAHAAALRLERPATRLELVVDRQPLPGDQNAADREQRKRQLDEIRQRGDGPGDHGRPAPSAPTGRGELLGPLGPNLDDAGQPRRPDRGLEKPGLLSDRLHEDRPIGRQGDREGDPGKPAARTQVEERPYSLSTQKGHRRQAVDDVGRRRGYRIADGREIDRLVPRQEKPNMVDE